MSEGYRVQVEGTGQWLMNEFFPPSKRLDSDAEGEGGGILSH